MTGLMKHLRGMAQPSPPSEMLIRLNTLLGPPGDRPNRSTRDEPGGRLGAVVTVREVPRPGA
jgi:hypothetical protein